jgi:hypothetical protein
LKEIVVAFFEGFCIGCVDGQINLLFRRPRRHLCLDCGQDTLLVREIEFPALIDRGQLLDDVIVETVEAEEEDGYTGRESQETGFVEAIWFEETVLERSDRVLLFLVVAVERGEIQVGGRLVDCAVCGICVEEISLLEMGLLEGKPWMMIVAM